MLLGFSVNLSYNLHAATLWLHISSSGSHLNPRLIKIFSTVGNFVWSNA